MDTSRVSIGTALWVFLFALLGSTACESVDDDDAGGDDGAGGGSDDDDSGAADDDDAADDDAVDDDDDAVDDDDDAVDDDDDAVDDDDDDDSTADWTVESPYGQYEQDGTLIDLIAGGHPGQPRFSMALQADGRPAFAACNLDRLFLHTPTARGGYAKTYLTAHAYYPELAIDTAGKHHVAYLAKAAPEYLWTVMYGTDAGGAWQFQPVSESAALLGAPGLVVDGNGAPHLFYDWRLADSWELRHATNADGPWITEVVAPAGESTTGTAPLISPAGVLAVAFAKIGDDHADVQYAVRDGAAWVVQTVAGYDDNSVYVTAAFDPAGRPHLGVSVFEYEMYAIRHLADLGAGWTEEVVLGTSDFSPTTVKMAVDAGANVYFGYLNHNAPMFARQVDGEWRNEEMLIDPPDSKAVDLAAGAAGVVHFSLAADEGSSAVLRDYEGPDRGWAATLVEEAKTFRYRGWVAAEANGTPHVIAGTFHRELLHYTPIGGYWRSEKIDDGYAPALTTDAAGALHVAYVSDENERTALHYATNASGAWEILDLWSEYPDDNCAIAVEPSGVVHLAHTSTAFAGPKVVYLTNAAGEWDAELVGAGYDGFAPALAVDQQGRPHLLYPAEDPERFVYAVKDNGAWRFETAFAWGGEFAADAALALDAAGRPRAIIAYWGADFWTASVVYGERVGKGWMRRPLGYSTFAAGVSVAIDGADQTHLAYLNSAAPYPDGLLYAVKNGAAFSRDFVDADGELPSLFLRDDTAHFAYLGFGALWYAHRPK